MCWKRKKEEYSYVPFFTASCVVTSMCKCTFLCTKLQETLHKCYLSRTKLVFPLTLALEEGKADLGNWSQ